MRDPQEVLRGVSRKEIWRYLGYSRIRPDSRVDGVIDSCLEELLQAAEPRAAWDRNRSWWRWRSAAGACPATWKDAAGYI